MERISESTIQQVKQFPNIVECIQTYVPLKRRGKNFIGLCPFHPEKTPSFTVSPEKRIFHCFGCHESGDLISFIEKIDNLTFFEAIEVIANFANISIEKEESSSHSKRQNINMDLTIKCLKIAATFFHQSLLKSPHALSYISKRHINESTLTDFNVGFLSSTKNLLSTLKEHDIPDNIIQDSKLISDLNTSPYCRFNQRLIFPIFDYQQRVIGFGGRVMDPNSTAAKYVNSEESPLFSKRKVLYGIHQAKRHVPKEKHLIIVEGYLDVLACYQHGIFNVAACMGTALTPEQVKLITRLTNTVVLMLDQDDAGISAMYRSYDTLKQHNISASIANLPNSDPAEFLEKHSKDKLLSIIQNASPALLFFYEQTKTKYDLSKIEEVSKCVQTMLPIINQEKDDLIKHHYIKLISKDLKIDEEILMAKFNHIQYNNPQLSHSNDASVSQSKDKIIKAEESIIYLITSDETLRSSVDTSLASFFVNEPLKEICSIILKSQLCETDLLNDLSKDYRVVVSKIIFEQSQILTGHHKSLVYEDCLNVLKEHNTKQKRDKIKEELKSLEKKGDEEGIAKLLNQLDTIKKGDDL